MTNAQHNATFSLPVYRSGALRVVSGANLGDALSFAAELIPSDVYTLSSDAQTTRLSVQPDGEDALIVAEDTGVGHPGAVLHLDSCLTLMSPDGQTSEVLVLVEVDDDGGVVEIYALPLAALNPKTDYALVTIEPDCARSKLAEVA